jgi:hypothetical protein
VDFNLNLTNYLYPLPHLKKKFSCVNAVTLPSGFLTDLFLLP